MSSTRQNPDLSSLNPSDIQEINLAHDDVFGSGEYSIELTNLNGAKQVFFGKKAALQVADCLRENLPEASKQIKSVITNDELFNNATIVFRRRIE